MNQRDKNYTWKGQLAVGKDGEDVVINWLRSRGFTAEDVRLYPTYQRDDIDLLVKIPDWTETHDGSEYFAAEVKTDTYANSRVFFETLTAEGNPGALFKSRARFWYIYKTQQDRIIQVQPAVIIARLWEKALRKAPYQLPVKNERGVVRAYGVMMNLHEILEIGGMVYSLSEELNDETDSQDPSTTEGSSGAAQE